MNLMVHEYARLDLGHVYKSARDELRDLELFLVAMMEQFNPD